MNVAALGHLLRGLGARRDVLDGERDLDAAGHLLQVVDHGGERVVVLREAVGVREAARRVVLDHVADHERACRSRCASASCVPRDQPRGVQRQPGVEDRALRLVGLGELPKIASIVPVIDDPEHRLRVGFSHAAPPFFAQRNRGVLEPVLHAREPPGPVGAELGGPAVVDHVDRAPG